MYLWLSHLMLAPFELSTLSTSNAADRSSDTESLSEGLPGVAQNVISVAFGSLTSSSKERESAVLLLIRLALRRDMQAVSLPRRIANASIKALVDEDGSVANIYSSIGHLSLLYSSTNLASDTEISPFLGDIYRAASTLVNSELPRHLVIKSSAPARKLLVKLMRACLIHAIKMSNANHGIDGDLVQSMLEDSIQYYLDVLGDKDSPVRMAASKALSIVAFNIDISMSAEVVEAVLGCLSENVLIDDARTGQLLAKTDMPSDQSTGMKRSISAVDALKWHGLMLTLGHLLFRRSPPPYQLPDIIEALLLGLEFEQRSNVGTSVGTGVRDAACFGIWALARKYSTQELESITAEEVAGVVSGQHSPKQSILQLIAVRLVLSACLDPSGNIRRGSSAALQELIGRHPDTILHGIPVVQVVDYHAIARRSRAMMEVAVQAANLDIIYHQALLEALLDWRGARAADADSRRWAGTAMGDLCKLSPMTQKVELVERMLSSINDLKPRNLGTTAGARHGLLLCAMAVIRSVSDFVDVGTDVMFSLIRKYDISSLTGNLEGRATTDLEVVMEAICSLFAVVSEQLYENPRASQSLTSPWVDLTLPILGRCMVACDKDSVVEPCAAAVLPTFDMMSTIDKTLLIKLWLDPKRQKASEMLCRGRLTTLAYLYTKLGFDERLQADGLKFLQQAVQGDQSIEVKTNAMASLCVLIQRRKTPDLESCQSLGETIITGLSDYTNDQRGDVGSLLRLQSLDAVEAVQSLTSPEEWHASLMNHLLSHVVRLAMEKLSKVRYRAWNCLKSCWGSKIEGKALTGDVKHLTDASSEAYFKMLMPSLQIESLRKEILIGLSSSIGGGAEDICRACSSALMHWTFELDHASRAAFIDQLSESMVRYLHSLDGEEDRKIIPALEFLAYLVDQELISENFLLGAHNDKIGIWGSLQRLHVANVTMERLGALITAYRALLAIPDLRARSLDKLTRQLLHRYPKVSVPFLTLNCS